MTLKYLIDLDYCCICYFDYFDCFFDFYRCMYAQIGRKDRINMGNIMDILDIIFNCFCFGIFCCYWYMKMIDSYYSPIIFYHHTNPNNNYHSYTAYYHIFAYYHFHYYHYSHYLPYILLLHHHIHHHHTFLHIPYYSDSFYPNTVDYCHYSYNYHFYKVVIFKFIEVDIYLLAFSYCYYCYCYYTCNMYFWILMIQICIIYYGIIIKWNIRMLFYNYVCSNILYIC